VAANDIVVVGMRMNPFPRRARKALDAAGLAYKYLEYGSYLSEYRRRLVLKMWTGWPTFPMVFVKGVLVGGAEDLARLIASGRLGRSVVKMRNHPGASRHPSSREEGKEVAPNASATPELIAAYEKALYVVFGRPELVIRIGEPNPDLDELLAAEGAATAAFITPPTRAAS